MTIPCNVLFVCENKPRSESFNLGYSLMINTRFIDPIEMLISVHRSLSDTLGKFKRLSSAHPEVPLYDRTGPDIPDEEGALLPSRFPSK